MNRLNYLVWVLLIVTILQSSLIIQKAYTLDIPISTKVINSGTVSLCINHPPTLNVSCAAQIFEHDNYFCQVNATDSDGDITFFSSFITNPEFFEISSSGVISFHANFSMVGNHSVSIIASDYSEVCGISASRSEIYDFEIINVNDPPELTRSIPGQIIPTGTQVSVFYLNSYFTDPDNDELTYTVRGNSQINIQIFNEISEVLLYSDVCDAKETVVFTAMDPGNLTAESNNVQINVSCEEAVGSGAPVTSSRTGSLSGLFEPCDPDWQCGDWSECTPNGTKTKICEDLNHCDPYHFRHEIVKECIYVAPPTCTEDWNCSIWSPCSYQETQTRTCIDLNACATSDDKPLEEQECTYIPTCSDGIQNQGETGVDCGGPCPPCQEIEVPGVVKERSNLLTNILLGIITVLLAGLIIYKYFHKQINAGVVKIIWYITGKKLKIILLNNNQKNIILKELLELENSFTPKNIKEKAIEFAGIVRQYFTSAFKLIPEFTKKDLELQITNRRVDEVLEKIFLSFFESITMFEFKKVRIYKTDLEVKVEELREIIHLTSKFSKKDVGKEIVEKKIPENISLVTQIKSMVYNTYITMQFEEFDTAKEKYADMLKFYEDLSEKKKQEVYDDIARLFSEIRYALSLLKQ
ncbi:MAG: hypothetical protein ABIC91_07095 [Nanoarchaeota archaeon]|nr:hypothetical protein [Nanoarchaeota archaeon]